jgi:hypothetical protein
MKNKVITAFATTACAALLALPAVAQTTAPDNGQATATKAPREKVTGTITAVDPARHMLTLKDANGNDIHMRVNRSTHIMWGDRQLTMQDLASDVNKNASVTYVQRARGDVARAIHIQG